MSDQGKRAAIYVSLDRGEDGPPLNVQAAESIRNARERGLDVVRPYGDVAGPRNAPRRRQIIRLFALFYAETLAGSIGFVTADPADRQFLGQQARAYGFSISVEPKHIMITTPWEEPPAAPP